MKTYITYDESGRERGYLQSSNHAKAEAKAQSLFGPKASVAYTEVSEPELAAHLLHAPKAKRQSPRVGDRVRCYLPDGTLDPVVYTVQALTRLGRRYLPVIHDRWQPVVLDRWEVVL